MSYEMNWIVPDQLVEFSFMGEIQTEDLMFLHSLDLPNRKTPVYILAGYHNLKLTVPQDSLQVLGKTQGTHPMIGYLAFYGAPSMIEIFAKLCIKLLRIKDRASFFPTREEALARVQETMAEKA